MDEPDLGQVKDANAKTNLDQSIDENHVILKSNERMLENENVPMKLFSPTSLREQNIKILAENLTQIIISNSLQVCREKRFEKKVDSTSEKSKNHDSNSENFEILTNRISDGYNDENLDEIVMESMMHKYAWYLVTEVIRLCILSKHSRSCC